MPQCIVVYDDECSVCQPMTDDEDCEGALCSSSTGPVALFPDRKAAQRAIRISVQFAKLRQQQGKLANEDFLQYRRFVKIRNVEPVSVGGE